MKIKPLILSVVLAFSPIGGFTAEDPAKDTTTNTVVGYITETSRGRLSVKDYVYMCLALRVSEISLSAYNMNTKDLRPIIDKLILDNPQLLVLRGQSLLYSYSDGTATRFCPVYISQTLEEHIAESEFTQQKLAEFVQFVSDDNLVPRERLELLHDTICLYCVYDDKRADVSASAYSLFKYRKGTCQGFTSLFNAVAKQLGFETAYVTSENLNHMWSAVLLDGVWYHVDTTKDAEASETSVSKKYFMLTEKEIEATHGAADTWKWITD